MRFSEQRIPLQGIQSFQIKVDVQQAIHQSTKQAIDKASKQSTSQAKQSTKQAIYKTSKQSTS